MYGSLTAWIFEPCQPYGTVDKEHPADAKNIATTKADRVTPTTHPSEELSPQQEERKDTRAKHLILAYHIHRSSRTAQNQSRRTFVNPAKKKLRDSRWTLRW